MPAIQSQTFTAAAVVGLLDQGIAGAEVIEKRMTCLFASGRLCSLVFHRRPTAVNIPNRGYREYTPCSQLDAARRRSMEYALVHLHYTIPLAGLLYFIGRPLRTRRERYRTNALIAVSLVRKIAPSPRY